MAMVPDRSKSLHNFTLPCLKWRSQKYMRCMKNSGNISVADRPSMSYRSKKYPTTHRQYSDSVEMMRNVNDDGEDGIEAVRKKITLDLKTAVDRMKNFIFRDATEIESPLAVAAPVTANGLLENGLIEKARPWNLRTRRAACKAPTNAVKEKDMGIEQRRRNSSPLKTENYKSSASRSRSGSEEKGRAKFALTLSRKEIEEDYKAMTGGRPPRRPKKRPRIVQNQLDSLFPGLWLSEITVDTYKVAEFPESGKI